VTSIGTSFSSLKRAVICEVLSHVTTLRNRNYLSPEK